MTTTSIFRNRRARPIAAGAALLLLAVACGGKTAPPAPDTACVPGAAVPCRCEDHSQGVSLCSAGGEGFEACDCSLLELAPDCWGPTPAKHNDKDCPYVYSHVHDGQPCSKVVDCTYPKEGRQGDDGCFATATLACRVGAGGAQVWFATE